MKDSCFIEAKSTPYSKKQLIPKLKAMQKNAARSSR